MGHRSAPAATPASSAGRAPSPALQDEAPTPGDVTATGIDNERRPRLSSTQTVHRYIDNTNESQANLLVGRRSGNREAERTKHEAVRHDVAGTGFQTELGSTAGQEMDRVAVPARLRPGDDVVIGEPVDPVTGWRIKSGLRLREFPRRRRLIGRAAAGELVGDPPAPSDALYFGGYPDELPARADGPLDRQPLRAPGGPRSPVTCTARTHEAATVQQTIPGGGPAVGPQTPLEPLHGLDRRKRQCGAPQRKTAELRLRQPG